jgi:hypothetical protein
MSVSRLGLLGLLRSKSAVRAYPGLPTLKLLRELKPQEIQADGLSRGKPRRLTYS